MRLVATCGDENGQSSSLFRTPWKMHGSSLLSFLKQTPNLTYTLVLSVVLALRHCHEQVSNKFDFLTKPTPTRENVCMHVAEVRIMFLKRIDCVLLALYIRINSSGVFCVRKLRLNPYIALSSCCLEVAIGLPDAATSVEKLSMPTTLVNF